MGATTAPRSSWVFDVDGTLIDSMSGDALRPFVRDLFDALAAADIDIVLWSAGGADYARRRAEQFGLSDRIVATYGKTDRVATGTWRVDRICAAHRPTLFIDDLPDELPADEVDVVAVRPYLAENPHDRALAGLVDRARASAT